MRESQFTDISAGEVGALKGKLNDEYEQNFIPQPSISRKKERSHIHSKNGYQEVEADSSNDEYERDINLYDFKSYGQG